MKVKLQPPSGTELSPFSPIQPPAAITQVMLLANPLKVSWKPQIRILSSPPSALPTSQPEVSWYHSLNPVPLLPWFSGRVRMGWWDQSLFPNTKSLEVIVSPTVPLSQEKARLRYRLTFALGEQLSTEVGEVDQFPPVEQWGNL